MGQLGDRLGVLRIGPVPVEMWFRGGKCIVRAKLPIVGWREGELTAAGLSVLSDTIKIAQAKLAEAAGAEERTG